MSSSEGNVHRIDPYPTEEAQYIFETLVPAWRAEFLKANADYRELDGDDLGPKGLFPDINRKVALLKLAVWKDGKLNRDTPRKVALELVGHLFLLVARMDKFEE